VATIVGATIAPTLIDPVIQSDGGTWSFGFSEPVTFGVGGSGGFAVTASGGAVTLTYHSGAGTDTWIYTGSRTVDFDETVSLAYTQPGNGIKDATDQPLASFAGLVVTNNSSAGEPPLLLSVLVDEDAGTWQFLFTQPVEIGAGGSGGFSVTAEFGAVTLTYLSGAGTDTLLYSGSRSVHANETITLDYTQPGNGIENGVGVDLASITNQAVANDSGITGMFASGGTITEVGGNRIHTYNSSSDFEVLVAGNADILLAGGAGGGGAGGGGAGGFKKVLAHSFTVGT
ncbi:MAG: hypothetical protein V4710_01280, partial [Verrucomicrobiota bacterium]